MRAGDSTGDAGGSKRESDAPPHVAATMMQHCAEQRHQTDQQERDGDGLVRFQSHRVHENGNGNGRSTGTQQSE